MESQKSHPPTYVRLKRIESLIKAFFQTELNNLQENHTYTIKDILEGEFIKSRNKSDYEELILFMKEFLVKIDRFSIEEIAKKEDDFSFNEFNLEFNIIFSYNRLIRYRGEIKNLLKFNSGLLEAGYLPIIFYSHLIDSISKSILENCKELDSVLELFINPKKLSFTKQELELKFDYPKDNLDQIDLEFYEWD